MEKIETGRKPDSTPAEPEINEVDGEPIFHAPDEEGDDND